MIKSKAILLASMAVVVKTIHEEILGKANKIGD